MHYLRNEGLDVERLRLSGKEDEGDLILKMGGLPYVIEAKNTQRIDLASFVTEAEAEARNYAKHRGINLPHHLAIIKRRNHGVGEAYVTLPLHEWLKQVAPPF